MEQRRAPRRRVLKAGTIEFGRSAFSCVVRDRSDTGAKLDIPSRLTKGVVSADHVVSCGMPARIHHASTTGYVPAQRCKTALRRQPTFDIQRAELPSLVRWMPYLGLWPQ